jgi:cytochrome c oxidase subunit 1
MPRRIYTYLPKFTIWNEISTAGAALLGVAMTIFILNMLLSLRRGPRAPMDPWDHREFNRTLEWTVTSPPPAENFSEIPVVR